MSAPARTATPSPSPPPTPPGSSCEIGKPPPDELFLTNIVNSQAFAVSSAPKSTAASAEVHFFINSHHWTHQAPLTAGSYSLIDDKDMRPFVGFPLFCINVYDPVVSRFVPIPSFARIDVREGQPIILKHISRSGGQQGEDCEHLRRLKIDARIWFEEVCTRAHPTPLRKRKATASLPTPEPSSPAAPRVGPSRKCKAKRVKV